MDRKMPVMDGVEATRRIRQLPHGEEVKIVAITASVFKEQQQELFDAGMDELVRKPYLPAELYDALARQLGVKYVYRQPVPQAATSELSPSVLAKLPELLRQRFHDALVHLDYERIMGVVAEIEKIDPELVRVLTQFVEMFDYPAILKALDAEED